MVPESWNDPENIFLCSKVRRKGSLQPPVVVVVFFFNLFFTGNTALLNHHTHLKKSLFGSVTQFHKIVEKQSKENRLSK